MGRISIVIPLYNKQDTIRSTIESILQQSFQDFEIVIVNDGSTDDSLKIISSIDDPRVKIINQPNSGVSVARNRGIEEASGEYIAFLDADDRWASDYLTVQCQMISRYPECSVFATGYMYIDENNKQNNAIYRDIRFKNSHGVLDNYFEVASKSNPPIWTSAVIIKKTALLDIGGFPAGVTTGEDLLTWAKLACDYKIAFCKQNLAFYFSPAGGTLRKDPKDMSLKNDRVGNELCECLKNKKPDGWRLYLSFWYKMRAVINLKKDNRIECIRYSIMALKFNPFNLKAIVLLTLSAAPNRIISKVIK